MTRMITPQHHTLPSSRPRVHLTRFILATAATVLSLNSITPAFADTFDEQIKQKQAEVNALANKAGELQVYGDTLQSAVNNLQGQINELESRISSNEQKRTELGGQIETAQQDIIKRQDALSKSLQAMYIEGNVSNLEKLASSSSISEYLDKQEYRNQINQTVSTAMGQIKTLKTELESSKVQVEQLIADDQTIQTQINGQRTEQQNLLNQTKGEEAAYQAQVKGKKDEIAQLRAAQIEANRKAFGGQTVVSQGSCGGGYPAQVNTNGRMWGCNYPLDNTYDTWGLYNRECVSYTAWKVYQSGRYMPYMGGHGNAYQWPSTAGVPKDFGSGARVGDVAISMAGPYGHAMYVEAVSGNQVYVSEYNYNVDGKYSERWTSMSNLYFLHF